MFVCVYIYIYIRIILGSYDPKSNSSELLGLIDSDFCYTTNIMPAIKLRRYYTFTFSSAWKICGKAHLIDYVNDCMLFMA